MHALLGIEVRDVELDLAPHAGRAIGELKPMRVEYPGAATSLEFEPIQALTSAQERRTQLWVSRSTALSNWLPSLLSDDGLRPKIVNRKSGLYGYGRSLQIGRFMILPSQRGR